MYHFKTPDYQINFYKVCINLHLNLQCMFSHKHWVLILKFAFLTRKRECAFLNLLATCIILSFSGQAYCSIFYWFIVSFLLACLKFYRNMSSLSSSWIFSNFLNFSWSLCKILLEVQMLIVTDLVTSDFGSCFCVLKVLVRSTGIKYSPLYSCL